MIGLVMAGGRGTRMDMHEEKLLLEYEKPIIFHVIDALENSHCFSKVIAATSPNSPDTKRVLEERGIETLDTPGNGYVADLNFVLQKMDGFVFVVSGDLPLLDGEIIQVMIDYFWWLVRRDHFVGDELSEFEEKAEQAKAKLNHPANAWNSFLVTKKFLDSLGLEHRGFGDEREIRKNINCVYTGISIINTEVIKRRPKRSAGKFGQWSGDDYITENHIMLNDKRIAFNLNTNEDFELLNSS